MNTHDFYKKNADELKSKMNILLLRYQKSYPLYKSNPNINEYKSMYDNDMQQIQNIINELFLLESMITKDSETKSKNIESNNNTITNQKTTYNLGEEIFNENKNNKQAGPPRLEEFREKLNEQYYIFFYYVILFIFSGYLIKYKIF
jgi:hypothetical protein